MDPMILIIQIIILIISVIIHEVSHGAMANYLGDPTAKYAGRLTLNPLKHLDLWGSFIVPLSLLIMNSPVLFGWAKPVPVNFYNLKKQKSGPALVAAAGPVSNLLIALFFGLCLRIVSFGHSIYAQNFVQILIYITIVNILLAVFNLIPIPPLDGSKILFSILPYKYHGAIEKFEKYSLFFLLFFIFFLFQYVLPIVFWIFKIIAGTSILI